MSIALIEPNQDLRSPLLMEESGLLALISPPSFPKRGLGGVQHHKSHSPPVNQKLIRDLACVKLVGPRSGRSFELPIGEMPGARDVSM
jgi:hypothetical protein